METKTSGVTFASLEAQGESARAGDYTDPQNFEALLEPRQERTDELTLE